MPGGGKRERKSRLDKGQRGATEFTGFAAFATPSSSSSSSAVASTASGGGAAKPKATPSKPISTSTAGSKASSSKKSSTTELLLRPSPLYMGSDSNLTLIFRKIGQKRDAITKTRALVELSTCIFPPPPPDQQKEKKTVVTRQEQIRALSHLIFLYTTKLHYDNNSNVRSEVLNVLLKAKECVPKAWKVLVTPSSSSSDGTNDNGDVCGMVWCDTVDPMLEVRKSAARLMSAIIASTEDDEMLLIKSAVCNHVQTILNHGRAVALHDALFSVKRRGDATAAKGNGGKKEKKAMKKAQAAAAALDGKIAESEKEDMEERYERVLLCALDGLTRLVTLYPEDNVMQEKETAADDDDDLEKKLPAVKKETTTENIIFLYSNAIRGGNVIWKHMSTSRGSFRRATYTLVASLCQHGKSLISSHTTKLSTLIPNILSSEKDPANFPSLIEMILLYIASIQQQRQQQQQQQQPNKNIITAWDSIDKTIFMKAMSKVLKKGCYGSSALQWGPSMLPLIATLPQDDRKVHNQFLSALWEGHKVAIGAADTSAIIAAVAECASFLLLRRLRPSEEGDGENKEAEADNMKDKEEVTKETAQYFIDAISHYLETPKFLPKASNELLNCLARDLYKLDTASHGRNDCGLADIKQWFWEEGIPSVMTADDSSGEVLRRMSVLLQNVMVHAGWQTKTKKTQSKADADQKIANKQRTTSHLFPICKKNFHHLLERSRSDESKTMKRDETALFLSIILFCGFDHLFAGYQPEEDHVDTAKSVEYFCMNDLLRWIISRDSLSSSVLKTDYKILQSCLCALPTNSQRKIVWESMLKEMIKAQCNLRNVALGLSMLESNMCEDIVGDSKSENFILCPTLDNLAVEVGNNALNHFRHLIAMHHGHPSDDSDTDDEQAACLSSESIFIKTCVGLEQHGTMLISADVVKKWIEAVCQVNQPNNLKELDNLPHEDEIGSNSLLEVLLCLALSPMPILSDREKVQLSLESWRQGGPIWNSKGAKLAVEPLLYDEFMLCASTSLKEDLQSEHVEGSALIDLTSHSWSKRAWRLHELHGRANELQIQSTRSLIGLDSIDLWKSCIKAVNVKRSEHLYLCLMHLLHNIDGSEVRRELFLGQIQSRTASSELMVHVLVALVDTNEFTPRSMTRRVSRLEELLDILGGKDGFSAEFVEACCHHIVQYLSLRMQITFDRNEKVDHFSELTRGVTVLDFLVGILFGKFRPAKNNNGLIDKKTLTDYVNANDVKEGDILWYVKDGTSTDKKRVQVKIVKVHTDDFPNLYFTIREEGTGVIGDDYKSERQTVSDRLKSQEIPLQNDMSSGPNAVTAEETAQTRQHLEGLILKRLVLAQLTIRSLKEQPRVLSEVAAECANTVISHCGLTGKAGVGSVRYDTFQVVSSLEKFICGQVASRDLGNTTTIALRCISSVMGFGLLTKPSSYNFDILRFKPDSSIGVILHLYEDVEWLGTKSQEENELIFHSTVLTWIRVAIVAVKEGDIFRRVVNALNYIGATLLNDRRDKFEVLLQNSLTFAEAVVVTQKVAHQCIDYSSDSDAEKEILSRLIMCFASIWQGDEDGRVLCDNMDAATDKPVWLHPFLDILRYNYQDNQENLLLGAKAFADDLVTFLFSVSKRWCALQILIVLAKKGGQLYTKDKVVLSRETLLRLESWKERLDEQESEEIDEDVQVTALWLPHRLMAEIESWGKSMELHEGPVESIDTGRLLTWLIFIDFLESAALSDMRNKVAISSYIENTVAIREILALAMRYADIHNQKDEAWKSCISIGDDNIDGCDLTASKIATLVIFRTVEVLPTLVKKWWSDDCPRSLQSQVSSFVQNRVAPDTLQRELARIDSASGFGDMKVSGSCVSREVMATYVQDECQLSVMIKIPPSFPLRNVEVDCQKTLGIAENRWRHWALQIMLMLNSQDGSVMDALLLWKQNVDKEFEGVEPCPVCYSVLCVKTHAMPKLECKTCHNRFHASCLYKWFHSSGKSQCVLCQQPWSGTKI